MTDRKARAISFWAIIFLFLAATSLINFRGTDFRIMGRAFFMSHPRDALYHWKTDIVYWQDGLHWDVLIYDGGYIRVENKWP